MSVSSAFPNAGKSTFLASVTRATPKIANYPFTTLEPNLGVVAPDGERGPTFVLADIPGLIEGAAAGRGLGHDFLRHVERTRVLIHVLDGAGQEGRDPLDDFVTINAELREYRPELADRPQIVAFNKMDTEEARDQPAPRARRAGSARVRSLPVFRRHRRGNAPDHQPRGGDSCHPAATGNAPTGSPRANPGGSTAVACRAPDRWQFR